VRDHPDWARADADLRAAVRFHVETEIEQEYGADWSVLSAWWFDAAEALPGGDARPLAGYDRLLAPLAAGLDALLGTRVLRLRAVPGGVVAELAGGGQVTGRAAVVTLPLGVLKAGAVAFDPPLAAPRQRAIDRLGMGLLTKLILRFERRFWGDGVDWLGLWGADHAAWVDATAPGGPPMLLGLRAGAAAAADERLAPTDRAAAALADLRAAFGTAVPAPVAVQASRWHDDPLARGAYSYHPPGSVPADRAALAGPDWGGRLVFAGEAAAPDHPATVHGAVLSGRAAAAALA
jgi:monoamine oxidase